MPNGGVPMHMVLYPTDGAHTVVYCHAGIVQIYDRAEWDANKSKGVPRLTLTEPESAALAWFLRYWLGEARLQPGYNMRRGEINAEFDF